MGVNLRSLEIEIIEFTEWFFFLFSFVRGRLTDAVDVLVTLTPHYHCHGCSMCVYAVCITPSPFITFRDIVSRSRSEFPKFCFSRRRR